MLNVQHIRLSCFRLGHPRKSSRLTCNERLLKATFVGTRTAEADSRRTEYHLRDWGTSGIIISAHLNRGSSVVLMNI